MPSDSTPQARRTAVRGLALLGLAVTSLGMLVPAAVALVSAWGLGLVITLPPLHRYVRKLATVRRRLAGAWSSVDVPEPYRPAPPPPAPEQSGMYRWDNHLYKSPRIPAYLERLQWLNKDRASWRDLLWLLLDPPVGGGLALLVIASVPFGGTARRRALRLHGRWTGLLLGPSRRPPRDRPPRQLWLTMVRAVALLGLAVLELATFAFLIIGLIPTIGLGMVFLFPPLVARSRWLPNLRRQLARSWAGVEIPVPYRPQPPDPTPRPDGLYELNRQLYKTPTMPAFDRRFNWYVKDPATWRDLLWLVVDPIVGGALLLVPVAAAAYGSWALLLPAGLRVFTGGPELTDWYGAVAGSPVAAIPVGLALTVFGFLAGPAMLRLHARWTRLLLAPTERARLARRVTELTESRTDANDAQVAELRRIERDLHDGAQARLVAVGLSLGAIERLIDRDPAAAKALVAQARETSAAALADLRDLVRGIHPPVLAERGLVDAIRALALDSRLDVEVRGGLPGRPESAVESAAYFTVAELLANAAKHAAAESVRVDVAYVEATAARAGLACAGRAGGGRAGPGGRLRVSVRDDGGGGADESRGTGLRGVRRRLGTFDGVLTVDSPVGGPTTVTMELPCVLSSPRTSTS